MKLITNVAVLVIFSFSLFAINEKDGKPWNGRCKLKNEHENEFQKKFPKGGFFINLGPTGIRAIIDSSDPDKFIVKYVFLDELSPARGKIFPGDVIIGANDKIFKQPHVFSNKGAGVGWQGPIMELSQHIENSQSKDGVLKLIVLPKGDKLKKKHVEIKLKTVGAFSKTYPWNCPRSEKRAKQICDLIADGLKNRNIQIGGPHSYVHAILALMAHGYDEHEDIIKKMVKKRIVKADPFDGGLYNWYTGFSGILLGEYSILYKTNKFKNEMEAISSLPMQTGYYGIFTHKSILALRSQNNNPYASIAGISGLAMLTGSLFKKAGFSYSPFFYDQVHKRYLNSAGKPGADTGSIAYCFRTVDGKNERSFTNKYALIKLKDSKQGLSGKGPGYLVPKGMENITDYELIWPKAGNAEVPEPDWLKTEKAENLVIECVEGYRFVYRNNPKFSEKNHPEPKEPFNTAKGGKHSFPVGLGAAAHLIDNEKKTSWIHLGNHLADTCALSFDQNFDGHGGGQLHGFWTVVGAGMAKENLRRKYLDYLKCFLIISETHYGSMIIQPWGRDRNITPDTRYGPQILPLATAAILLSLPKQRLQITGAYKDEAPVASKPVNPNIKKSPVSIFRPVKLDGKQIEKLNKILLGTLNKLQKKEKFKDLPIKVSFTKNPVILKRIEGESLTFQSAKNKKLNATIKIEQLNDIDYVNFSILLAAMLPENKTANAFVCIYLEQFGNKAITDKYLGKTSKEDIIKIQNLIDK